MCVSILPTCIYVYTTCDPGYCRDQKRVSEPLKPEFQMVVICHVGAGNGTPVLCRSSQGPQPLSHLSSSTAQLFYFLLFLFI